MAICDLPDDTLCRIFSSPQLDFAERIGTFPLVCKRWSSVLQQPSAAWQHVSISYPNNYSLIKKWMKLRAAAIRALDVDIADHVGAGSHDAALLVGSLIQIAVNSTSLGQLHIVGGNKLDMSCEKWLPNLRGLSHLYLEERMPDHRTFFPSWFIHMNHLTQLTYLEIRGDDYDLPYNGSLEYQILPEAIFKMRDLQVLKLQNLGICAFSEEAFTEDLIKAASSLDDLRKLIMIGFELTTGNHLTRLTKLETLSLSWGPYEEFDASPLVNLQHFSYEFYGCADQMLSMALILPQGLQSLRISTLGVWRRNPATDEEARRLERESVILRFLESRVNFPSSLTELDLSGLGLPEVPEPVLALKNLRTLLMAQNRLETLPEGDYLQKLDHADFKRNRLSASLSEVRSMLSGVKVVELGDEVAEASGLYRAQVIGHSGRAMSDSNKQLAS